MPGISDETNSAYSACGLISLNFPGAGLQVGDHLALVGDKNHFLATFQAHFLGQADDDDVIDRLGGAESIQDPLDHGLAGHIDERLGLALRSGIKRFFREWDPAGSDDCIHMYDSL